MAGRGAAGDGLTDGGSIVSDLDKAIQALRQRPHRLDQCMKQMQMTGIPKALLWQRIKALQP